MRNERALRMFGLLKQLGQYEDVDRVHYLDRDEQRQLGGRTIRSDELKRIAESLGIEPRGTKPELRTEIRKGLGIGRKRNQFGYRDEDQPLKEGRTRFSSSELMRISNEYEHSRYLDVDDLPVGDSFPYLPGDDPRIVVNGQLWNVDSVKRARALDEWDAAYDKYVAIHPDDRTRLMLLFGLDKSQCRYDHSVVIESARDYGPYEHWKKESYVREFEVLE